MTLDVILAVGGMITSALCAVVYKLTNEKKYFGYVNQVVGK